MTTNPFRLAEVQCPMVRTATEQELLKQNFRGCLLGGAIGDALGAPVEFMDRGSILHRYGDAGICDLDEICDDWGKIIPAGTITDDTQMTLFTAEGLIRAYIRQRTRGICHVPSVVTRAYLRWLHTQGVEHPANEGGLDGWLITHTELYVQRKPGYTCLSALSNLTTVGETPGNESKGCGAIMRIAPVGMHVASWTKATLSDDALERTFRMGYQIAAITHGHPTGRLPAAFQAALIVALLTGDSLDHAISRCREQLQKWLWHEPISAAIDLALNLAGTHPNDPKAAQVLGEGWLAHETLSISLYYAVCAADFESGLIGAVNHGGDCDSIGAVAGNILGAIYGEAAIPERWLLPLELRDVIESMADDLAAIAHSDLDNPDDYFSVRYPPH